METQKIPRSKVYKLMPCGACKLLRRRCTANCIFLPYFPPSELCTFAAVHRVFGASNVCRMLREIPSESREDAVKSMVYEAKARLRDPVYGSAGLIASLQNQVASLQFELNAVLAETVALRAQLYEDLNTTTNSFQTNDATLLSTQQSLFQQLVTDDNFIFGDFN